MDDSYPGASSFQDRHGQRRWRFRRKGKTICTLPGQPGDPEFEAAYQAVIAGQSRPKAVVRRIPGACAPKTFADAWRRVQQMPEWLVLDDTTKYKSIRLSEELLGARVTPEVDAVWRDMLLPDLRRRHVKGILASFVVTPHKARQMLVELRRMITVALDEEWIESDPSYGIKWNPPYQGWKAWPAEYLKLYQDRWPVGTKQRLIYASALWLGNRAGDVAALRWDWRCTRVIRTPEGPRSVEGFMIPQEKGRRQKADGKAIFVPIAPAFAEVLAATPRVGSTVLVTTYGTPHSKKSLTNDMAAYTAAAGIPRGYTLHGLRKTLGKRLGEGGASTRQLMEVLGHVNIAHAELYSREADQVLLATEGMDKVVALFGKMG